MATPHPETFCQRCGRPNLRAWHAPSPLWNAVMRSPDGSDEWSIVCPQCFAELAAEKGIVRDDLTVWCLRPDQGVVVELPTVFGDGRVWDAERCQWVEVPA